MSLYAMSLNALSLEEEENLDTNTQRHRGQHHVTTEAKIEVICLKARGHQELLPTTRKPRREAWKDPSLESSEGSQPADTLT